MDLAEVGIHVLEQDLINEPGRQWTYYPLPSANENDNFKWTVVALMCFDARNVELGNLRQSHGAQRCEHTLCTLKPGSSGKSRNKISSYRKIFLVLTKDLCVFDRKKKNTLFAILIALMRSDTSILVG